MSTSLDPLVRDLLAWIGSTGRPYDDVMDAWRTSCPHLPVWEDANDRGFVLRTWDHDQAIIRVTDAGRAFCRPDMNGRAGR